MIKGTRVSGSFSRFGIIIGPNVRPNESSRIRLFFNEINIFRDGCLRPSGTILICTYQTSTCRLMIRHFSDSQIIVYFQHLYFPSFNCSMITFREVMFNCHICFIHLGVIIYTYACFVIYRKHVFLCVKQLPTNILFFKFKTFS